MTKPGYFGEFGGAFVAETLIEPLQELAKAYDYFSSEASFQANLAAHLRHFVGRPTPLTYAKRLSEHLTGAQIYLKREDLAHTGAHKINNAIGQALLAKAMGKTRLIAETGAGQHGVATATVCAMLGLACTVYMGEEDMKRQALNVKRMTYLGAEVRAVSHGAATLKDAVGEALRDWVTHPTSYYLLGSALGPHPYPTMVRDFQKVIGMETRQQILEQTGHLPNELIACVGGGSNAIGFFYPFLADLNVKMIGVEAGGKGIDSSQHAARFAGGSVGVFQGTKTFILQDVRGQIKETHSISAGLDYPAVGPEHAHLRALGRIQYAHVSDVEALTAATLLAQLEGIIPALESAHALAHAFVRAKAEEKNHLLIVNVSGRGDKDMETYARMSA